MRAIQRRNIEWQLNESGISILRRPRHTYCLRWVCLSRGHNQDGVIPLKNNLSLICEAPDICYDITTSEERSQRVLACVSAWSPITHFLNSIPAHSDPMTRGIEVPVFGSGTYFLGYRVTRLWLHIFTLNGVLMYGMMVDRSKSAIEPSPGDGSSRWLSTPSKFSRALPF
jgi:hypothetical protein